jgi:hypothetical protein
MERFRTHGKALALAVLAAAWAGAAFAQPAAQKSCADLRLELAAAAPLTAVNRLANASCLGGELDADAAARRAQRLFDTAGRVEGQPRRREIKDVALSDEERRALTVAVLRVADDYLGTVASAARDPDKPELERARAGVQAAIRDRSAGLAPGERSREQRMEYWRWDGLQSELGQTGIDVPGMLKRAGCDAAPRGTECAAAQASAEGLLRGARLAERAFTPDQAEAVQEAAARAAVRDARWRSYFADARSQYPWELWINSWRYETRVRKDLGVSGPPDWQWIVLHPDIAMQYVSSAAAGDRFKPALLLEVIGYNWWQWGADNKPRNAWGVSLVRTYADTTSIPSSAWGVTVHRNSKYSLTVTRQDGKTGMLLSVDLAGAVTQASQAWSDQFRIGE